MATTKPRITITLSQRQHDVLRSISDSSGQPMSAFLMELLDVSMPTLERMAVTFQKLKQARQVDTARLVEIMDQTQNVLEPIAQEAVGQFDLFMAKVEAQAGDGRLATKGASARRPKAPTTPPTNRGATPHVAKSRKPSTGKASRAVSGSKGFSKKAS